MIGAIISLLIAAVVLFAVSGLLFNGNSSFLNGLAIMCIVIAVFLYFGLALVGHG